MKTPHIALVFSFALLLSGPRQLLASEPTAMKRVSLVFDDGPVVDQTDRMLAILAKENIHVNFCYIGKNVDAHPELARHALAAGHELNDHSYTHPHLKTLSDAEVHAEIQKCFSAIEHTTGKKPGWFWAPFLESDARIEAQANEVGLSHFPYQKYHFISTDDWNTKVTTGAMIHQRATTGITDRTVILCHEWVPDTLAQLPGIIAELKKQGCVFVTFSELAHGAP
jgi:peptidoglycan/xylan/chitin deacetylase (PgdA/CDA1 family)